MDDTKKFLSNIFPHRDKNTNNYSWIFFSLLSALLLILIFPNPGISSLAWISLVPLFVVIMTETIKRIVFSTVITAVLFNTVYLFWMKEYKHPAALSGGVFGELIFFFFAVMLSWFLYRNLRLKRIRFLRELTIVCGWMVIDYIKTIGFLGFPWGILAYSQYKNLVLIQTASIFGIWGINFILLYCNATIAGSIIEYVQTKKLKSNSINISIVIFFILLSVGFGLIKKSEERKRECRSIRVALIQGNFDPWSPRLDENITLEIHLTMKALREIPDLVVWSESSVPFPYKFYLKRKNKHALEVHNFIKSVKKPLVFGSIEFDGGYENGNFNGDFYNVAVYYNNGEMNGIYRKIHLVPFGEWFPFGKIFPFVVSILENAGAGDFTPGEEYVVFDSNGFRFNVLICFEDVFGNLARTFVKEGSELFINVTNDAWTGSRKAEIQHFSLSVFRTIENRRSLIRAANGGVTACINPYGRVLQTLELFTSDYLVCDVPLGREEENTIYTKYGDFFPKILVILCCIMLVLVSMKKIIDRKEKKNNM